MTCQELQNFVHPYVDGEFGADECAQVESHLANCDTCRQLVAFEARFKDAVRARLRHPHAPDRLRSQIVCALDRAPGRDRGLSPVTWRRVAPVVVGAAAMAAGALFFGPFSRSGNASPLVEAAISAHEKNLPLEVNGSDDRMQTFFSGKVPVPVRPPHPREPSAFLMGARIGHLHGLDAAQIVYRVRQAPMTVYVFDASDLPLDGWRHRTVSNHELLTGAARGYNVVLYRDHDVGYAFTSALDENQMVNLVSTSFSQ